MEVPEHLKINEPNDEQRVAVEHTGGVLLSAGAGSGKTFVLVEHMVYLFKKEYENLFKNSGFLKLIIKFFLEGYMNH